MISELEDLRENGLQITIHNKTEKIFFITCLILGDNLGVNGILGFVESFGNTVFCRICYASPDTVSAWSKKTNLSEEPLKAMNGIYWKIICQNLELKKDVLLIN